MLCAVALYPSKDDILDLIVVTPDGNALDFDNPTDEPSGGVYQFDPNEFNLGFHTQSVFFPPDGSSPAGKYLYYVDLVEQVGATLDVWTLSMINPQTGSTSVVFGAGTSDTFSILKLPDAANIVSGRSNTECSIQPGIECCTDSDCASIGKDICSSFRCISEGMLRFTLSWMGGTYCTHTSVFLSLGRLYTRIVHCPFSHSIAAFICSLSLPPTPIYR